MTLQERFAERMGVLLQGPLPTRIGIAVSGGSDSTALMHLTAIWAETVGIKPYAVTIDHGLRDEAAEEAELVRAQARALGVAHTTIRWEGWDGRGNLQDAARRARRQLLWQWSVGLDHILMGHTMDDQAETVLRNLARGSGVAGLSGMAERVRLPSPDVPLDPPAMDGVRPPHPEPIKSGAIRHDPQLLRPMMDMRRKELRDWLRGRGLTWSDDPSNDDPRYDRVRARQTLSSENALGLSVEGLAETARRLGRARHALGLRAQEAARKLTAFQHGDVIFDRDGLAQLDAETRLHLTAHALRWVASSSYRPRLLPLERAVEEALSGQVSTLHGCILRPERGRLRIHREPKAVADLHVVIDGPTTWDRRWRFTGAKLRGCTVQAAGESGLLQARELAATRITAATGSRIIESIDTAGEPPHASLLSAPAVFRGGDLIALPPFRGVALGVGIVSPLGDFFDSLVPV